MSKVESKDKTPKTSYPTNPPLVPIKVSVDNLTCLVDYIPIGYCEAEEKSPLIPIHPELSKVINQANLRLKEKDGHFKFNRHRGLVSFSGKNYLSLIKGEAPTSDNAYYPSDYEFLTSHFGADDFFKHQIYGKFDLLEKQREALNVYSPHDAVLMKIYPQIIEFCIDYPAPANKKKHVRSMKRQISRIYSHPTKCKERFKYLDKDFEFLGKWEILLGKVRGSKRNKTEKVYLKFYYKKGLFRLEVRFEKPKLNYSSAISIQEQLVQLGERASRILGQVMKLSEYKMPKYNRQDLENKIYQYRPNEPLWDRRTVQDMVDQILEFGSVDLVKLPDGFGDTALFKDLTDPVRGILERNKIPTLYETNSKHNVFPLKIDWQSVEVRKNLPEPKYAKFTTQKLQKRDRELAALVVTEVKSLLVDVFDKNESDHKSYELWSNQNDDLVALLKSKTLA